MGGDLVDAEDAGKLEDRLLAGVFEGSGVLVGAEAGDLLVELRDRCGEAVDLLGGSGDL